MGKTTISGPVYGAKSLLWVYGPMLGSQNTSTALLGINSQRVIPPYEDWIVTEASLTMSTNSSVVASGIVVALKTEGGSTTIPRSNGQASTNAATVLTMTHADNSTAWSTWATATVTAGEYEGTWCPAGSSLRLVSSCAAAPANVQVNVMGYIRYVDSSRAS